MADFLRKPVPFAEASEWIRGKPIFAREAFARLLPELRARAFLVSGLPSFRTVQDIRDAIATIPEGAIWADVKRDIADRLIPYIVDEQAEPEMQANQRAAALRKAELLIRTHGFQAYQAASWQAMTAQADVLPFWQYLSMEDGRVRPGHAALNGLVLPQDSPFWKTHFPPWEWNCRCQVAPLSPEDVARIDERDAGRPEDDRLVLRGQRLRAVEEENRLLRKGQQFDLTPSSQKPGADNAFVFDPSSLRIPLSELRNRYDPEVFSAFESWAKRTQAGEDGDKTVWEWLEG
jgi:SPP1 gp7 family putative phage head morphogenesis protein